MIIPTFQEIEFDREKHLYSYRGQSLKSVTQVTGSLKIPFDAERQAPLTAKKEGKTVEEVLAAWDEAGRKGREKGTLVHGYIDARAHNQPWAGEHLPEMDAFDGWLSGEGRALAFRRLEWIVGYPELGVAGTVDALAWNNSTQTYQIWDWKTGSKFNTRSLYRKFLLPPFDDLDECELESYSLQVSLYRLILADCAGIKTSGGFILHLRSDGTSRTYETIDYQARLREWLQETRSKLVS